MKYTTPVVTTPENDTPTTRNVCSGFSCGNGGLYSCWLFFKCEANFSCQKYN
ncbi:MAG: hypothetical protein RR576_00520 [Oscillospiraceae bacterium]